MDNYADVIHHPRYGLRHHRPMPEMSRAAQFSAFAALSGFDEEIDETARLTDFRGEQAEDDLAALDDAFRRMLELAPEHPLVTVICFEPDARKAGGAYVACKGHFRHYEADTNRLLFTEGLVIPAKQICRIILESE